jgi:hypothetical protein
MNPYESPKTLNARAGDNRRTWIAMIPFLIAVLGLIVAVFLWFASPLPREPRAIALGIVGAILIFDLPPPELSLSPLIPSRQEREFRRNLRERPKLNDDEFYARFYADSSIPKHLAVQLRALLATQFGLDLGALHPLDNLIYADVELDWAYLMDEINEEFDIVVPEEMIGKLDGTFDSLVRCIASVKGHEAPLPVNGA